MPKARYQVVLHELTPDATDVAATQSETPLDAVPEEQVRRLLTAFADLATRLPPTTTARPQIRIKFSAGLATITAIEGKLYYGSWDTKGRGIEVTVDDIMARVSATTLSASPAPVARASTPPMPVARKKGPRKIVAIALLAVAIVAMNATTVWMLLKPPRTILPPHVFLPDSESDALLRQVAGDYQTGPRAGDRHLEIEPLGLLHFAVYGKNKALEHERMQSGRGAKVAGGDVVITSDFGVIRMIDPNTISIYGDTYRRILN